VLVGLDEPTEKENNGNQNNQHRSNILCYNTHAWMA